MLVIGLSLFGCSKPEVTYKKENKVVTCTFQYEQKDHQELYSFLLDDDLLTSAKDGIIFDKYYDKLMSNSTEELTCKIEY